MDLLKSLNLNELPEQQTRTLHLIADNPDFDLTLGFDACCTCGKQLGSECPAVQCQNCRRVNYCSDACRHQDANVSLANQNVEDQEEDSALGHTAVICSLLRLCHDDELVENEEDLSSLDNSKIQAAKDRIQSEKESYPATLANAIAEGPCYVEKLRACAASRRLVIHVIGASMEAEGANCPEAYAEALVDLSDTHHLDTIELIFIGPKCPEKDFEISVPLQSTQREGSFGDLRMRTINGMYTTDLLTLNAVSAPDIVVFFNPGFTVPEYSWSEALACIPKGTPFLSTTNTELEGIADCQYLLDQDKIQTIPPGLADIFGLHSTGDPGDDEVPYAGAFFSENPFCGNRVRQNGTMANDLFVKNHWMLGGILDSFDPSKAKVDTPSKKQRFTGESLNSKASNPALI